MSVDTFLTRVNSAVSVEELKPALRELADSLDGGSDRAGWPTSTMYYIRATGSGDETASVQAQITAAGNNAHIAWPKRTQVTVSGITALPGQIWSDANILRANKRETTVTSAVAAGAVGSFSVDVTDPSLFSVGDVVSISSGYHVSGKCTILTKSGNTIGFTNRVSCNAASISNSDPLSPTYETSWSVTAGTPNVYITKVFDTVNIHPGCKLRDCEINGNKGNWEATSNTSLIWNNTSEIKIGDEVSTGYAYEISGCKIYNYPGEGIIEWAGGDTQSNSPGYYSTQIGTGTAWHGVIRGNNLLNGAGNPIHLSGYNATRITGNHIDKGNTNYGLRHVDGGICYSYSGRQHHIEGNTIRQCYSGVGSFTLVNHGQAVIAFNKFLQCKRTGLNITPQGTAIGVHDLQVIGNLFQDCGIQAIGSSSAYSHGFQFVGNQVYGGVSLGYLRNASYTGGFVDNRYIAPVEIVSASTITLSGTDVVLPAGQYYGAYATPTTTVSFANRVFQAGDEVVLTQRGTTPKISGVCVIKSVGGTAAAPIYTLIDLDTTFVAGPAAGGGDGTPVFIHSAKHRNMAVSTESIVHNTTTTLIMRDPSLFNVGDFVGFGRANNNTYVNNTTNGLINAVRITAIDYATGQVTFNTALSTSSAATMTTGTGNAEVRMWRGGCPDMYACLNVSNCEIDVNTELLGGLQGLRTQNDCSGSKFTGRCYEQRRYGVVDNGTTRALFNDFKVRSSVSTFSVAFWNGMQTTLGEFVNNEVIAEATVDNTGFGIGALGTGGFYLGNRVRALGTAITYQWGTVDRGLISYPGNWARNAAAATGEAGATGTPAATSTITLLPTV